MIRTDCARCGAKNAVTRDDAVLESGRMDQAHSCMMCGHIEYNPEDLAKSIANLKPASVRGPGASNRRLFKTVDGRKGRKIHDRREYKKGDAA